MAVFTAMRTTIPSDDMDAPSELSKLGTIAHTIQLLQPENKQLHGLVMHRNKVYMSCTCVQEGTSLGIYLLTFINIQIR